MTAMEIKDEIQKVLTEVPEYVLPEILNYLKEVQQLSSEQVKLNQHLSQILNEDKELLERLAQ
jgi:hypothetical protein